MLDKEQLHLKQIWAQIMLQELIQKEILIEPQGLALQNHTQQTFPIQEAFHRLLIKVIGRRDRMLQIETR